MDIKELDSYNLRDAVQLHSELNPRLFSGDRLRPEVRAALLEIAEDFREYLGVNDLRIQDITFSGSNAAYAYTPHSDIDLHLVVEFPGNDEIYRELFDAKKYQYNETHDITVRGYDVELYVQDAAQAHHSAGVYSIKDDDWVKMPRRQRVTIDDRNVKDKYETLKCQIQCAIDSQDYSKIVDLQKKIKNMRSAGLEKTGEFGPENLAFKMLRTQGLIKQLIDARNHLKSQELSIDEQLKERFVWGFSEGASGYIPKNKKEARDPRWSHAITQDIGPGEVARQAKRLGFSTDAAGVPPRARTNGKINESTAGENRALEMDRFARFVAQELGLGAENMPEIEYTNDINRVKDHRTFGTTTSQGQDRRIWVYLGDRNTADAMRTLAHELVHAAQFSSGQANVGMDKQQEQRIEDQANALAGRIMRKYGQRDSSIYETQQDKL